MNSNIINELMVSIDPNPTRPRPNTEMNVVEQPLDWIHSFNEGWLAHFNNTGTVDWSLYKRIQNRVAPAGKGIDLADSRLILISSAGFYIKGEQQPFDAANLMGDYSLRVFPTDTPIEKLAIAHEHYNHQDVEQDHEVLLPIQHLQAMVAEGLIGELAPIVISFMGYQPNVLRIVKELIPQVVAVTKQQSARGALLVPS